MNTPSAILLTAADRIKDLAAAATPGPWTAKGYTVLGWLGATQLQVVPLDGSRGRRPGTRSLTSASGISRNTCSRLSVWR